MMTGIFWTTLCLVFIQPIISANENRINHERQLYIPASNDALLPCPFVMR